MMSFSEPRKAAKGSQLGSGVGIKSLPLADTKFEMPVRRPKNRDEIACWMLGSGAPGRSSGWVR